MIGLGSHSRKRPHQRAQLRGGLRRKFIALGRFLLCASASHDWQIGAEGQCQDDTGWTRMVTLPRRWQSKTAAHLHEVNSGALP